MASANEEKECSRQSQQQHSNRTVEFRELKKC